MSISLKMLLPTLSLVCLGTWTGGEALAKAPAVPTRQVPPTVMAEVQLLENEFELALAADCDDERCFSRGCTYVDHAVADRPRSRSLPGLTASGDGPGATDAQEYLTQAQCSFAHEEALESADVGVLTRRLQAKLSGGWLVVSVVNQGLTPLPAYMREPPPPEEDPDALEEEEVIEEPEPEPEPWTAAVAGRELWAELLPHFFWMLGLGLLTLAGIILTWSWRRVGRDSLEEQALLAQLTGGDGGGSAARDSEAGSDEAEVSEVAEDDFEYVARQDASWRQRLDGIDAETGDPEIEALIRELLRAGDMPLLAKAMLRFPEQLPAAFPSGGDVATAKLALADTLKTVDPATLPSDRALFEALNRHSLAAALSTQGDAEVVRSLREDFGAAGLVELIGQLPARQGALVFALAPASEQHEMVRLFTPLQSGSLCEQLLRSNRMDPREATALFAVLQAARAGGPLPSASAALEVTDRGPAFDAVGALSVLLPSVPPTGRGELFSAALRRHQGTLPAWYRGILVPDMLLKLSNEALADLLLEVDVDALAAWLSIIDGDTKQHILQGAPASLQTSIQAVSIFPSRTRQLAQAERGRSDLARGFQRQLARTGIPFEEAFRSSVVVGA